MRDDEGGSRGQINMGVALARGSQCFGFNQNEPLLQVPLTPHLPSYFSGLLAQITCTSQSSRRKSTHSGYSFALHTPGLPGCDPWHPT